MAYWGLVQGPNLISGKEYRAYLEKAMALGARLPERERWRIEGAYYSSSESTVKRSIKALSRIIALYPWDEDAVNDLGIRYFNMLEDTPKAIKTYEAVFNYLPQIKRVLFLGNLSAFYDQAGQFEKSEQLLQTYLKDVGENRDIRSFLGNTYLRTGRFDAVMAEADRILLLDPSWRQEVILRGRALQSKGLWTEAEREFRKNLDPDNPARA